MRPLLDGLYRLSGAIAATFLVAICSIVLLQVTCNIINSLIGFFTGVNGGLIIPSYAEFAGYFLAAASFFALAYTFRHGAHIRVSLILMRLGPGPRKVADLFSLAAATAMTAYATWYMFLLVLESLEYNDMSPGIVPIPLWLPQTALAMGLAVLLVALIDTFFSILAGEEMPEQSELSAE